MIEDTKKIVLKFYNTETRELEQISPLGDVFKMYTCGPTVYDYAHIGNFRTYVFEDLLRRTLKYFGFPLKQAMNITDVEDKTIQGALKEHLPLDQYTKKYKDAFFQDIKTLNIQPAEIYPEATAHIPEMIAIIENLLEKGAAYKGSDECIYFRIKTFPSYGRLSHLNLRELKAGASERISEDEYEKEGAADFVLWKSYRKERDGDVCWDSPFGKGRPGWHIECSAMAIKHLGETIDLHVGGVDNIFPHHENEIAQSEVYTGKPFVRYWMHSEHLLADGRKMSKRLGNFYTLRDLLVKGYLGREVRFLLLQTHYRKQLNFTFEALKSAKHALQRLDAFIQRLHETQNTQESGPTHVLLKKAKQDFISAIAEDLNISEALGALFDLVREINALCDQKKINTQEAKDILAFLRDIDQILGILFLEEAIEIPKEVQHAFDQRQTARLEKNFKLADSLRSFIEEKGFIIEDSPTGSRLKRR